MALKVGIVGLPNVGKSTLFSAITQNETEIANYPFATIKPHSGIVSIEDKRLDFLSKTFNPLKTIPTSIEFVDIAGLVKGASRGEGLGNQFLANIRECDAIIEVVRAFESSEIIHVEDGVDPIRDIEIIDLELVIADLETLKRRIDKVASRARINKDKEALFEIAILEPLLKHLEAGKVARTFPFFSEEQREFAQKNYHLITLKPTIYVANLSDDDISSLDSSKHFNTLKEYCSKQEQILLPLSLNLELEISNLPLEDRLAFLEAYGLETSGLNLVAKTAYDLLNLATFFTVGKDECRAWTFKKGMLAPGCAGIIHTDFEKGFIKAEVYSYSEFEQVPNEQELRKLGKIRIEGKNYIVQDGDIMFFRFNV